MTNIFFQPLQILLFRNDQDHIQYYDNIILQRSNTLPSPTISYGSRRNSLFSSHSFNYDSTDDSLPYPPPSNNNNNISISQRSSTLDLHTITTPINNNNNNNNSTSTVSMTKLRSSKKVKDKALLFEKLIQNESKQHSSSSSPHYQYSSPYQLHNNTHNSNNNNSFSFSDDIDNSPKTKYLSRTYMDQLERSKSPTDSIPTRRIVSTKLSQYENHINNLNHIDNIKK